MRIALVTVGSLGDVAPILALALGLRRAGHEARVVTHASFAPMAQALGVDLCPTAAPDPRRLVGSLQGREVFAARNPLRSWRRFAALGESGARTLFADTLSGCEGMDAVGWSGVGMFPGYAAASRLGVPHFAANLIPIGPTSALPGVFVPQGPACVPGYNRLSRALTEWLAWRAFAPLSDRASAPANAGARFPSLPAVRASARVSLFGISPAVVPMPARWGSWARFTGYWFLDDSAGWEPPPELLRFLAEGPPPVVVGFGSMVGWDPGRATLVVVEALQRAEARGILLTGWGGLEAVSIPSRLISLVRVPHAWLLPRVAAVVHHGGAGTTAAAARAGIPSVVVPFAFDQPFWADRLRRLGAAPAPVPERCLTPERLADAIRRAVENPRIRAQAAALGARIRAEDGVGTAVRELERTLGRPSVLAQG